MNTPNPQDKTSARPCICDDGFGMNLSCEAHTPDTTSAQPDPYATLGCVHCSEPTTGTVRVGNEDLATCQKTECIEKSQKAGKLAQSKAAATPAKTEQPDRLPWRIHDGQWHTYVLDNGGLEIAEVLGTDRETRANRAQFIAQACNEAKPTPAKTAQPDAIATLRSIIGQCLSIDVDYNRTPIRLQMREDAYKAIAELERVKAERDQYKGWWQNASKDRDNLQAQTEALLAALRLCARELQGMHSYHHPTCEGGCPFDEANSAARAAIADYEAKGDKANQIENIICDQCDRPTVTDGAGDQVCHNCGLTYQIDE